MPCTKNLKPFDSSIVAFLSSCWIYFYFLKLKNTVNLIMILFYNAQIDDNHVIRYISPDEFSKTVVAERRRRLVNSDRVK